VNEGPIQNSPVRFVEKHIERYLDSAGADATWHGMPSLLITTMGRTSGTKRRTALVYQEAENGYIVIASQGGRPTHPNWYLNIQANGYVEVQVGSEVFEASATVVEGERRVLLWQKMTAMLADFDDYQARTERRIPVLLLHRKAA
jgi:deazaflavin-dependent oxidoreductase (nitroreductase family)